jgi:DNA-binding GntR family transcriptional regulator
MPNGKSFRSALTVGLEPLSGTPPLGTRVYQALVNSIVSGGIQPGSPLRPDAIARQLEVSTTPVREAMQRLEAEGLAIKAPYQGWFVRQFSEQEIRELYELRAALECFAVRLACRRITPEQMLSLRSHQATGEAALAAGDMDAYRIYNRDLHQAILAAARNAYLESMMAHLRLHSEMLMARTIRITGRPLRAIEEHQRLLDLIELRDLRAAEQTMEHHILSALEDVVHAGTTPLSRTSGQEA